MKSKNTPTIEFGKHTPNEYSIIERKFKDGNTKFFVKVIEKYDGVFGITFDQ